MLERLWTSILDLIAQFVTPDWGRIIGLLPVVIFILIVVVLLRLFARLMTAPKARRDVLRVQRKTPAGIHMPGPSFAPVFAAVGLFLLLLGLVFGGPTLILGGIALVLTLLYWLGEGLRLYDRDVGPTRPEVPLAIASGPPPGVHMPGPSWRPFLGAFGVFLLLLGLVFGGLLLAVGVIALISTLIGWLFDAIQEYRLTVQADSTGHLENAPPPNPPSRLLSALIVLVVAAVVLQSGVFGTGSANGTTGSAAASGAPAGPPASSTPASGGGASGAPPASGPTADVQITAQNIAFLEKTFTAPAAKPFTIAFSNEDAGTPHDVELKDASGAIAWKGDVFSGVETRVYQVPALPAGTYTFLCIVHQNMTGTATLQ
jgi:plastocyanin